MTADMFVDYSRTRIVVVLDADRYGSTSVVFKGLVSTSRLNVNSSPQDRAAGAAILEDFPEFEIVYEAKFSDRVLENRPVFDSNGMDSSGADDVDEDAADHVDEDHDANVSEQVVLVNTSTANRSDGMKDQTSEKTPLNNGAAKKASDSTTQATATRAQRYRSAGYTQQVFSTFFFDLYAAPHPRGVSPPDIVCIADSDAMWSG